MIYLKCECGNGLGVPGSFTGESLPCDDCGRSLRLVAGRELGAGGGAAWRLEVQSGPPGLTAGEQILLGGDATIEVGKGDGKHLLLPGSLVSRAHCRLVPTAGGGWRLEDTGSRNGVFVNGAKVMSVELETGDLIGIGEYVLRFGPAGPAGPAVPAGRLPQAAVEAPRVAIPPLEATPVLPSPPPSPTMAAAVDLPTSSSPTPEFSVADRAYADADAPDAEYELAEPAPLPPPRPRPPVRAPGMRGAPAIVNPTAALGPGPTCPCCRTTLGHGARICVACGIDVKTGRPLLTAQGLDEDTLHVRAENTIRLISWLIPFGLYPIASEARGHCKPYAVWAIAAVTLLASLVFFGAMVAADDDELPAGSNLMLWAGDGTIADHLDDEAIAEFQKDLGPDEKADPEEFRQLVALILAEQHFGEFHAYQLLTHALLHGDLLHIAGNFLFLLVLGTRVNALLGNVTTAIVYPILAVAGGVAHLVAASDGPPGPMLGASGAIMGLAGIYIVLLPAYRVHMAIWLRLGLLTGFRLAWKIFAVRGFWVVLFYMGFDVLATAIGSEDQVAHWAHLGGFLTGAAVALVLLFARLVNANRGDLVSVALGKYAWPLLGRPGQPAPAAIRASAA